MKYYMTLKNNVIDIDDMAKIADYYHTYNIYEYIKENYNVYKEETNSEKKTVKRLLTDEELEIFSSCIYTWKKERSDEVTIYSDDLFFFTNGYGYVVKSKEKDKNKDIDDKENTNNKEIEDKKENQKEEQKENTKKSKER